MNTTTCIHVTTIYRNVSRPHIYLKKASSVSYLVTLANFFGYLFKLVHKIVYEYPILSLLDLTSTE